MTPRDTRYRLAASSRDYARCHALLRAQGPDTDLTFPTVLAEREGQVVGFLSTRPSKQAIIAGPLVIDRATSRPAITAWRLADAYEIILRRAGVTSYAFHVSAGRPEWVSTLGRLGFEPWQAEPSGGMWYRRAL